ncbi:uncharacterized protein KGF55_003574 [Candida pseudojiufengensis]|uniref:uncharacterized protein n=1 Tax=Candida pseudojiufengensis TaxID=497109 RepID=UPI002224EA36|nr:uncharacterized protein KGF55_003574 [Candida pseudojiufengensis]KAI5962498.1 hypothetical protein KGF55_003574 [Candida pseudojiufengensis]
MNPFLKFGKIQRRTNSDGAVTEELLKLLEIHHPNINKEKKVKEEKELVFDEDHKALIAYISKEYDSYRIPSFLKSPTSKTTTSSHSANKSTTKSPQKQITTTGNPFLKFGVIELRSNLDGAVTEELLKLLDIHHPDISEEEEVEEEEELEFNEDDKALIAYISKEFDSGRVPSFLKSPTSKTNSHSANKFNTKASRKQISIDPVPKFSITDCRSSSDDSVAKEVIKSSKDHSPKVNEETKVKEEIELEFDEDDKPLITHILKKYDTYHHLEVNEEKKVKEEKELELDEDDKPLIAYISKEYDSYHHPNLNEEKEVKEEKESEFEEDDKPFITYIAKEYDSCRVTSVLKSPTCDTSSHSTNNVITETLQNQTTTPIDPIPKFDTTNSRYNLDDSVTEEVINSLKGHSPVNKKRKVIENIEMDEEHFGGILKQSKPYHTPSYNISKSTTSNHSANKFTTEAPQNQAIRYLKIFFD